MLDGGGGIVDDGLRIDVCRRANIDRQAVEMSRRLASFLIIVKTLVCTHAIKGFYYDEMLCRLAKLLVDHVENLEQWCENLERRRENLGGEKMSLAGGFELEPVRIFVFEA